MADKKFFQHSSLPDAASQIRLLRLQEKRPDGRLSFSIHNYQLSEHLPSRHARYPPCPAYIAISYIWGSPDKTHEVVIEGKPFGVGANCHYALSQAVHLEFHDAPEQHYWIDQNTINQEDRQEKGEHVSNMGGIFRRASKVFACVGTHADHSRALFDAINGLYFEAFESLSSRPPCYERRELVKQYLKQRGHPENAFEGLREVMARFAERPYWHRL